MSAERSELVRWATACALLIVATTTYMSIVPRMVLASVADAGRAAELNCWAQGAQAAASLVFAPTVGALSDKYGRPLLFATNSLALGATTLAVALGLVSSAGWVALCVLLGTVTCSDFVARAALSTGDKASQASMYGALAGANAVGSVVGMQLAGAIASSQGPDVSLMCGAGFALAAAVFACCLPDRRSPLIVAEKNFRDGEGAVADQCTAVVDQCADRTAQRALDIVIGVDAFAGASFASLGVIYCTTQLGLGAEAYAQVLTLFSGASLAGNLGLLPVLRRASDSDAFRGVGRATGSVSRSDLLSAACGLAMSGIGFACTATGSLPLLILAAALAGTGTICQPGLIAARVSATGTVAIRMHGGTVQGRIARIQGLSMAMGPLVFSSLYANVGPRVPFIVASLLEFTGLAVICWLLCNREVSRASMAKPLLDEVGTRSDAAMGA